MIFSTRLLPSWAALLMLPFLLGLLQEACGTAFHASP